MRSRFWNWHLRAAFVALAALLLARPVSTVAQNQEKPYPEPDPQLQLLKNQFNTDMGKVRLLVIVDPTCPPCRRSASIIRENVMEKITSDKLVAYVVWVPLLNLQDPPTLQRHAHEYSKLLPPSPRVMHYSDLETYAGKKYGSILSVPYGAPAWDVYMAFGADAHWGDAPPKPNYSAGLAVPFLLVALATSQFVSIYQRWRRRLVWVERFAGALLIVVGALVFFDLFQQLSYHLSFFNRFAL